MKRFFGTDGIRGRAGEHPLDLETVTKIGRAFAEVFQNRLGRPARFVSGCDTRESGPQIEAAFHHGARSGDAAGESASVITTPGVAFLTKEFSFDAGIVISASHNPFQDNGIKIFLPSGEKLDETAEKQIEEIVNSDLRLASNYVLELSEVRAQEFRTSYLKHFRSKFDGLELSGLKIVADCANGAASAIAPELLQGFGADVAVVNASPDGKNINKDCGSLHLEHLQESVNDHQADFGVAFDGDADRSLFVDEKGNVVDGDATLWILANHLKKRGKLGSNKVVATMMSNIGLEIALRNEGIELIRTAVGDKYVLEELIRTGVEIGGEQSGHIILPRTSLVGDGMMTALQLLRALMDEGSPLSQLSNGFVRYPQILLNVKVRAKKPFEEVPEIVAASQQIEASLKGGGRLLLRYSGTEDLARVMIEGPDQTVINEKAHRLAEILERVLG